LNYSGKFVLDKTIADKVILSRVDDGSATKVAYTPGTNPGDWVPTEVVTNPDGITSPAPAVLPQWGNVKTFGIPKADVANNRPTPPPALTSEQYATEFNQVKDLGAAATVLTSFYGDNYQFSTTGPGLPGVTRSFTSFNQAAEEAGMSRIYRWYPLYE
jgi:hypothetical protein